MRISSELWIGLASSIGIGIFIFILAVSITWYKIKKIKNEVRKTEDQINKKVNKALERPNSGELLWELKNKYTSPLEDIQLEYLINTVIRNGYKSFAIIGFENDYEEISLTQLANVKKTSDTFEIAIINGQLNVNDNFNFYYKKLKTKKMIAVTNASKRNKEIKKLINYLKISKIKYDYFPIGKGIIFVVK